MNAEAQDAALMLEPLWKEIASYLIVHTKTPHSKWDNAFMACRDRIATALTAARAAGEAAGRSAGLKEAADFANGFWFPDAKSLAEAIGRMAEETALADALPGEAGAAGGEENG